MRKMEFDMRCSIKKLVGAFVAALLVTLAAPANADEVGDSIAKAGAVDTQLTDELKLADEAFSNAYQNRDIWAMSQLWAKDDYVSAIFPAAATPAFGWDNVRRSWQQTFDHNRDIKIKSLAGLIQADGEADGDLALIISSTQFQAFQTQTGQPVMLPNVLTTKLYEHRGGKWLLVQYHAHQPGLTPPMATDEETGIKPLGSSPLPAIQVVDDQFYKALRDMSMDEMSKVWSSSAAITAIQPDASMPFMGRDNVMASWESLFRHNKAIEIPQAASAMVHVAGDKAWVIGSYQIGLTRRDTGEYMHLPRVLVTKLFQKEDGTWRLAHYHAHVGPLAHSHGGQNETPIWSVVPGSRSVASNNAPLSPTRTINIDASEMTFGVDKIDVKPGEIIRFIVTNKGEVRHEFAIGTHDENAQMQAMMQQMPDMVHNSDNIVTVEPGQQKELIWRVPDKPDIEFSCNIPGHAEAGMRGSFNLVK